MALLFAASYGDGLVQADREQVSKKGWVITKEVFEGSRVIGIRKRCCPGIAEAVAGFAVFCPSSNL
jgi:hypothetical protein